MPNSPSALTIRMYNVGFGDCFLLTFEYPRAKRHVLVDFGSTAAPKRGPKGDYMRRIAEDIQKVSGGKLHGVVATHRHRDHISGFSTQAKSGQIIASLKPDFVIQPWTEDPQAKPKALTASGVTYKNGRPTAQNLTAHFLGSLEDMHAVAHGIEQHAVGRSTLVGPQLREQLRFLGDDNIKNASAIDNLIKMGKAGSAYYVNAGMKLNVLPGVKCTVLGPPTLKQSNAIRKERARDPDEFWQFRSFWAVQGSALGRRVKPPAFAKKAVSRSLPVATRWFVAQSRQIQANQMLSIVRDLDSVMNNTSVILLLQIGTKKILLPGDAQIENWAYALARQEWVKLLADVNLYKVGHHGSLNATPKSLWKLFGNKGKAGKANRLATLCSTKAGKHGSVSAGTEVPRRVLLDELMRESEFTSTEDSKESFCHTLRIPF
jgi:beta-lactamase superfamily II metal-dependent hydrolase